MMFAALAFAAQAAAPPLCAAHQSTPHPERSEGSAVPAVPAVPPHPVTLYLEADPLHARDSSARVRLCLATSRDTHVNSLSARVVVDTAFGQVEGVAGTGAPSILARADTTAGTVRVAGASTAGLSDGALVTIRVRLARPGTLPRVSVVLTEMNTVDGTSLATRTNVGGLDVQCAGDTPALLEVLPPAASADPGEPLDLRIDGCGFSADKNVVRVGEITVRNVRSTERGTHIRLVVPKELPSRGEVPPMLLGAGAYDVTVNNGRGTSNAKRVTLR
jgi:hypothetical protein